MRVLVRALTILCLAALSSPAWSQPVPVDVSGQVSGIVTLRGPESNRGGDTATVCASNLGTRAATINVMLRDVERLGQMLSLAQMELEPGQGSCHSYVELELAERKAIAFVWLIAQEPVWNGSRQLRAVKSSVAVTDALGDVRAYADLTPKVVSIAAPSAAAPRLGDGARAPFRSAELGQLEWVKPCPAHVAGPLPLRGAGAAGEADTAEVCAVNLGGEPVSFVLEIRSATRLEAVHASSVVALEPGSSACVSHVPEQDEAIVAAASACWTDNWSNADRSLVVTTETRHPRSIGIRTDGQVMRVALPSAP